MSILYKAIAAFLFVIYVDADLGCVLSSGHESSLPPLRDGAPPGVKLPGLELQVTEAPQRQLKAQKRRVPPPSKVGSFTFFTFQRCTTEDLKRIKTWN